jgi:hypothetical protein
MNTPVDAKANDVPYLILDEPNGNSFRDIGFRSVSTSADCGVSGALVITNNASYAGYGDKFDACWFENLHVPTGGTIINASVNGVKFTDIEFHDCYKESAATGTSFVTFKPPTTQDYGGNIWEGSIPGTGGTALEIDKGIFVKQSRNRFEGVRLYSGNNIVWDTGVVNNYANIGGSYSTPIGPAVIDNSGNTTNIVVDTTMGHFDVPDVHAKSLTIPDSANLLMGTAALQGVGGDITAYSDMVKLYNGAGDASSIIQLGNTGITFTGGSALPNGNVTANPGSIYLCNAGGAATTLWVKESGFGNTGWVGK